MIETSGKSIKFTVLAIFALTMLLKILLGNSSSLLWNFSHILQLFRVIILINVVLPKVIVVFASFLDLTNAGIEEIDNMIPDVILKYLLDTKDLTTRKGQLEDKYIEDYGLDSPYYIVNFSK